MAAVNPIVNPGFTYDLNGATSAFGWITSTTAAIKAGATVSVHKIAGYSQSASIFGLISYCETITKGSTELEGITTEEVIPVQIGVPITIWYSVYEEIAGHKLEALFGSVAVGTASTAFTQTAAGWNRRFITLTPTATGNASFTLRAAAPAVALKILHTAVSTTETYIDGDVEGYEWEKNPGKSPTNFWNRLNHPGAILPSGPQLSTKYTLTGPDGTVATFNDPSDPNFVGSITEVTGLDSPEVRENAENIVGMDGGVHGSFFHGRRPITLAGTIYNVTSNEDRNIKVTKLLQSSNAMREDATLEWTPAGGERQFVKVRRQQPVRITGGWSKSFQLLLVAADPRIYGTTANAGNVVSPIVQELIATGIHPKGCATDGVHVYWTSGEAFIGRATVSGGSVEPKWVAIAEVSNGIAVDAGHVYWNSPTGIGRCTVAGGTIESKWLAVTTGGVGLAVDAGHIYWANQSSIGRATIAGATIENTWINPVNNPQGICVDAGHIYWADRKNGHIARATIAGASVEAEWIKSAGNEPAYPSVTATNIYWCCYGGGQVRRANLNGEEMMENFINAGAAGPYGSAIMGTGETATLFVTNFNEGTISSVPITGYKSFTNSGSIITYPLIVFTGKPRNFEIVNSTTKQKIVINYNPALPIAFSGGLPTGVSYVTNDGTYFWYVYGTEKYGKIGINGAESNPTWGNLSSPTPYGFAVNGSKTFTAVVGSSGTYDIYTTPKTSYVFEPGIYFATLPEEIFGLAVNETNIFWGDRTNINRSTVAGTEKTTIITGANMLKGSQILVTATKLWWATTTGEIKESLLSGASPKTIVSGTKATSIAVDAGHIYWTNTASGTIGRSTITGTEVEEEWVSGQGEPKGILVSATAASWMNTLSGTLNSISLTEPSFSGAIDTLNRTVSTATGSIYGSVNFAATEWFGLVPGENKLELIEQLKAENMSFFLEWRNAWI
jgi:hypothetical protein